MHSKTNISRRCEGEMKLIEEEQKVLFGWGVGGFFISLMWLFGTVFHIDYIAMLFGAIGIGITFSFGMYLFIVALPARIKLIVK